MPTVQKKIAHIFGAYSVMDFTEEERNLYFHVRNELEGNGISPAEENAVDTYNSILSEKEHPELSKEEINEKKKNAETYKALDEKIKQSLHINDREKKEAVNVLRDTFRDYTAKYSGWQRFWGHIFTGTEAGQAYQEYKGAVKYYSQMTREREKDVFTKAEETEKEEIIPENKLGDMEKELSLKNAELEKQQNIISQAQNDLKAYEHNYNLSKYSLEGIPEGQIDEYVKYNIQIMKEGKAPKMFRLLEKAMNLDHSQKASLNHLTNVTLQKEKIADATEKVSTLKTGISVLSEKINGLKENENLEKAEVRRPLNENEQSELNDVLNSDKEEKNNDLKLDDDSKELSNDIKMENKKEDIDLTA